MPKMQLVLVSEKLSKNNKIRSVSVSSSDYFIQQRMHAPKVTQSDPTNPYIQIMFNINSKNVVNNNILSDRQRDVNFCMDKQDLPDKAGNIEKKDVVENRAKMNKSAMNKGSVTMVNTARQGSSSQEPISKQKKKMNAKTTINNLSISQTQRSSKNTVHKKDTSQGFSKVNPSQQAQLSQKRHVTKPKSRIKSVTPNSLTGNNHKNTRQKIIQLMIRDYQRGSITADNLKEAISSLIEREAHQKRLTIKTQYRSEKARTRLPTSYKNSLAASLHNTPKHKPSKSKSQKFHYHSQQPSLIFKLKQPPNHQPQIIQRVIHNKQFMSKIIIKGINSSLFLSNDWTDKESPIKESQKIEEISVNVINTSDSVRDLKKGMHDVMIKGKEEKEKEIFEVTGEGLFRVNKEKQKDTKNILANFIDQLKGSSRNEFMPASAGKSLRQQKSVSSSQNSLKYFTRFKQQSINDDGGSWPQHQQQYEQKQQPNSLDEFYVKQRHYNNQSSSECSRIEELQRQYALLLKDRRSESRDGSDWPYQSGEQYKQDVNSSNSKNNICNNNNLWNRQTNLQQQKEEESPLKIKSYMSSQLSSKFQTSGPLSEAKQQVKDKRAKSITQSQIKKLNQIMEVIKDQLSKKQSATSTNQTKNSQVLQKIVTLLEAQKTKVQQELKLYGQFEQVKMGETRQVKMGETRQVKMGEMRKVSSESSGSHVGQLTDNKLNEVLGKKQLTDNKLYERIGQKEPTHNKQHGGIEQNQIINSFQKKLHKKLNLLQTNSNNNPIQPLRIYYQSSQIKSPTSSRKSLSSNTSSHHLQKVKISQLNLDEIQLGLRKRLNDLQFQRQQEYSIITQKFINDKINPRQYQQEKDIIDKWFFIQSRELSRIKKNLLQGYKKAKQFIFNHESIYDSRLTKEKSTKMIKCISQKYLNKGMTYNNLQDPHIIKKPQTNNTHQDTHMIKSHNTHQDTHMMKTTDHVQNQQQVKKQKKITLKTIINNLQQPQKPYQTIQQLEENLLTRSITPIQKFLSVQKQQNQPDAQHSLSIQQSGISRQGSKNTLSNQNDTHDMQMVLEECENDQNLSEYVIRDNKIGSRKKSNTKNKELQASYQYQYQQVKSKRHSSVKISSQIAHYLNKYEQGGSSDEKSRHKSKELMIDNKKDLLNDKNIKQLNENKKYLPNDKKELLIDNKNVLNDNKNVLIDNKDLLNYNIGQLNDDKEKMNDQDQQESSSNSQAQYLQQYGDGSEQADNEQSSNEQYYGYNDTQEAQIDINKTLPKLNNNFRQPNSNNQQAFSEFQGLTLQQHPHPNIIINKPSLREDQIFSPKKPTAHEQFSQQLLQYNSTDANNEKVSLQFTKLNKQFNQTFLKLKYLTQEDKDDIFEFMFLDLCLELFLEQTKNNKIMKSIEKYIVWQCRKKKIPKGFKTGLQSCKLYITNIQQFLLNNHLSTLKRLQTPMGPSAKQMLKFMRDYEDIQSSQSQIQTVNLVLPIQIYQKFQSEPVNKVQVQRYYDDDQKQQSRLKFLKSLKHFHNKAMFDSLNEMLDVQRSYGIWGKPFPWKKALNVDRNFDQDQIKKKLKRATDKLLQNCSYFCGVLVDKEESVFGKGNVSEQYLHHIRQDRMSKMLSNDMIDNEDRWIFYDDQQAEDLVSLSKSITADLISEVLQEIKFISWK